MTEATETVRRRARFTETAPLGRHRHRWSQSGALRDASLGTLDGYQREALRTASLSPDIAFRRTILALGIAGEAGEVADLVKKEIGHGHPEDSDRVFDELGDVLWYVATLADAYGLCLCDVAERNIAKLRARYPNGFSTEASIERRDASWEEE